MEHTTVLTRSLSLDLEVGANRRGAVSGAGWLYALPRLRFRRVVCVGAPSPAALAGLARATTDLLVIDRSAKARARVERQGAIAGWPAVVQVAADDRALAVGRAPDLLVVSPGRGVDRALVERMAGRLAADGITYHPDGYQDAVRTSRGDGGATLVLDVRPGRGEARSIVPEADVAMQSTMRRLGLEGRWIPERPLFDKGVRRLPEQVRRMASGRANRRSFVLGPQESVSPDVPAYVRSIAGDAGRDVAGWGWGVAARGDYDSQKVLLLLRPPGSDEPSAVVKITRSEAHGARLENEADILAHLTTLPIASGRAPVPWFSGHHGGRVLLGESMVEGAAFGTRARWTPDCPFLADATAWLTELGAATRVPTAPAAIADALLVLLDRYDRVYRPVAAEHAALRERFEGLGRIGGTVPTVLQHGDPGTWNLVVDEADRTVFLDWESAELDGLPLWDLLYFARSYVVAASRRSGLRDRLDAASRHLLDASPLGDRVAAIVDDYRARVGVPGEAVEALLYGCWVHRSLKEAGRMDPARVDQGQFVRLVRRMLARPDAPTLARMTGHTA